MALEIRSIECYDLTVADQVQDGSRLLSRLAEAGVDLLAFKAAPVPTGTRFTLLPTEGSTLAAGAKQVGVLLEGPRPALLIKGGEEPGALAGIYRKLAKADIPVREASGIAGVNGGYGVVLYLEPQDCARAAVALMR